MILLTNLLIAQEDHFNFNFDVTIGSEKFEYEEIMKGSWGSSSLSWNEDGALYSIGFGHKTTIYTCLNLMGHIGISVPVLKKDPWSIGFRSNVGLGQLFTISKYIFENSTGNEIEPTSEFVNIKAFSLDVSSVGYVRYNIPNLYDDLHIDLYGGYRLLKSYDNYGMPVFGFEFGAEHVTIGFTGHFTKLFYYRELSNGAIEKAKTIQNLGSVSIHYYIGYHKK